MIAGLKRTVLSWVGLSDLLDRPAFGAGPDRFGLKDQGYRVTRRGDYWHWHHRRGSFSGRYTTERAAWTAAADDADERRDDQ